MSGGWGGTPADGRRRDVQGLRALAVLAVVVFHAGLPLSGGYLGVDVFFVISGFVITAMLERDRTDTRTVDFRAFYRRRFARLTPALVVMVVVTVVVASVVFLPFGLPQTTAETGLGAIGLVANFVIARTSGNYFDPAAETNPLLHTWSLSVEEQIYLVFPALIAGAWLLARRRARGHRCVVPTVVALAGVGSLALMVGAVSGRVDGSPWVTGFYSPVTRVWEFVAGALLAYLVAWRPDLGRSRRFRVPVASAAAVVGLVAVVGAMVVLDADTESPGLTTLVPVAGTVLVLAAGSWVVNPVSHLLGTGPATWLGDRSYSVYLWHWPPIVFAAYVWPDSTRVTVLAAAAAFLPALLSYRYVEQPGRARRDLTGRRFARFATVVVVPGVVVTLAGLLVVNAVVEPRFRDDPARIAHPGQTGWRTVWASDGWTPCPAPELRTVTEAFEGVVPSCRQTGGGRPVDLAVVGDSHALHLMAGLETHLVGRNVLVYSANGYPLADDPQFADAYAWLTGPDAPSDVIITFLWQRSPGAAGLAETVRTLTAAGRRVFLLEDVPSYPFPPERCKYQGLLSPRCTESRARFDARNRFRMGSLHAVATETGATLLPSVGYFCDATTCSMLVGERLGYRDENHLNLTGSRHLVGRLVTDHPDLVRSSASDP